MASRRSTIYDACAGRLAAERFIPPKPVTSTTRDTPTSSKVPITPQESLLGKGGAPTPNEEVDWYSTHRELPDRGRDIIPDTDLLEALHGYVSDFYGAMGQDADVDWDSLDETALLALGVLVEEQVREVLGREGDMVFVEGEDVELQGGEISEEDEASEQGANPSEYVSTLNTDAANAEDRPIGIREGDMGSVERLPRRPKKRSEMLESRKKRKKRRKVEYEDRLGEDIGDV